MTLIRVFKHIYALRKERKELRENICYIQGRNQDLMDILHANGICSDCGEPYHKCDVSPEYEEMEDLRTTLHITAQSYRQALEKIKEQATIITNLRSLCNANTNDT